MANPKPNGKLDCPVRTIACYACRPYVGYIQMSIIYMKEQEKEEEKVVVVWWRRRRGGGSGGSRIFLGGLKGDFCFGITSEKRGMKACRLGLM